MQSSYEDMRPERGEKSGTGEHDIEIAGEAWLIQWFQGWTSKWCRVKMKAQRPTDPTDQRLQFFEGWETIPFLKSPDFDSYIHNVRMDKPTMAPNQSFYMECSPVEEIDGACSQQSWAGIS